jgi:hypothetical protein
VWRSRGRRGRAWRGSGLQGRAWRGGGRRGRTWCGRGRRGLAWHRRGLRGRAWRSWDHRGACWEGEKRNMWLNHRVRRKQRLQLRIRRGCKGGGVGEVRLVEDNVSGDKNSARGEVKTTVPLVVRRVPEEHTPSRPRCQLVRSGGREVRVARTPEDTKVVVTMWCAEASVVWRGS